MPEQSSVLSDPVGLLKSLDSAQITAEIDRLTAELQELVVNRQRAIDALRALLRAARVAADGNPLRGKRTSKPRKPAAVTPASESSGGQNPPNISIARPPSPVGAEMLVSIGLFNSRRGAQLFLDRLAAYFGWLERPVGYSAFWLITRTGVAALAGFNGGRDGV